MTKFMLANIFILFLLVTFSCSQEQGQGRRFSPEDQLKNLTEKLELTEEQADSIKSILKIQREEMQEMRDSFEGERYEMRDAMMEFREETDKKINKILSNEQKGKYQEMQEERRERRQRRQQ